MNPPLTSTRPKPFLNEEAFQQLLEAAYVIQQQNDKFHGPAQKTDPHRVLTQIIETQRAIHAGHLDLAQAMRLIVDRLRDLTSANWAAVGLIDGDELKYRASSSQPGCSLQPSKVDSCLSAACLRTGEVVRYVDLATNGNRNSAARQASGIKSFIAVPVYAEGAVAGVLELGFPQVHGFDEKEISTCQLMAGLMTEAMSRAAEFEWKQTLAAERATMLETLERIKPQLERLVEPAAPVAEEISAEALPEGENKFTENQFEPIAEPVIEPPVIEQPVVESIQCRGCGNEIAEEEAFCGLCGLPTPNQKPTGDIQSKWASMWHMQQAAEKKKEIQPARSDPFDDRDEVQPELRRIRTSPVEAVETDALEQTPGLRILPHDDAVPVPHSPWSSATLAKKWLDSLHPRGERGVWLGALWRRHRANVYLGLSVLLLVAVIAGWDSGGKAQAGRNPARPRLSLMERALIALNLAEAPPAPVYLGNPSTQVWVDLHTALYYCPGEEHYGNTEGGKMTTQRDAQQDQFRPALRKACD